MKSIKKLRGKYGLTQKQLGERIGMSKTSVVYVENDKTHTLSPKFVKKICEEFGVEPFDLFEGFDNLKYPPTTKEELGKYIKSLQEEYNKWV